MQVKVAVWCALSSLPSGQRRLKSAPCCWPLWRFGTVGKYHRFHTAYGCMRPLRSLRSECQDIIEGLGKWWLFAPLILPPLLKALTAEEKHKMLWAHPHRWGYVCPLLSGPSRCGSTWLVRPSSSLATCCSSLLPIAFHKRHWLVAVILGSGILATQAQGPMYSMLAVVLSLRFHQNRS